MRAVLVLLAVITAAGCAQGPAGLSPAEGLRLDPEMSKRAVERWGKYLVPVEIWLQRSEGEDPSRFTSVGSEHQEKRPLVVVGLAVDPRTIWIPDMDLERRFIARLEAGDPPQPAALQGTFLRAPGWVVRTTAPMVGLEPIDFIPAKGGPEGLYALGAQFDRGGWVLNLKKALGEHYRLKKELWMEVPRGSLLIDRELKAVGYCLSGRISLEGSPDPWRGAEIAAGPVLDFEAFERARETLVGKLTPWALTVRGFFRREEEVEGEGRRMRRFRYHDPSDQDARRNEFLATGFAVGPHRVLVNHALNRDTATRLERAVVMVEGEERPARFLGAFRHYYAFLMELEGPPLREPLDLASERRLEILQPVIAATADHRTGRRRDLLDLNRVSGFLRGHRGFLEPVLLHFPRPATLLLGVEDHAFAGAVLEVNRESDADEPHRSFRDRTQVDLRVLHPADLRDLLAKGEAAFDLRLAPRPFEREKDIVWLGVDFQPLTRELARSHGVELPTRGGEIGLMVLGVHRGSPAARAGLQPGDILLVLRTEDEPEPIELQSGDEYDREDSFHEMMVEDVPEEMRDEFLASTGPPWRSPRNFLNEKLTRIGEGRKVELVYLRSSAEERVWIRLETAPPDFENARKYKAEELGLTIKDLSYEVRSHYRLKDDDPGVVVGKVEPGGKAAIARVLPYEILVSVNGQVIRTVEEFRRILEERAPAGERLLELKLERMGKSRLVRIQP